MTYDTWKTTEPDDQRFQTREQMDAELAEIEKEIAWNERRLVNLVWGEDDRQQTEDFIADLRQERDRLLAAVGAK